jgi:hypothetical protein
MPYALSPASAAATGTASGATSTTCCRRFGSGHRGHIAKVGNNQKASLAHIGAHRRRNAGERAMSLLVAVFNEKSDWSGKTITYEDARHQFILEGRGPIGAQALLGYDARGQLDWAEDSLREWTQRAAQAATPATPQPPSPSTEAAAAALSSTRGAPGDKAARLSPAHGTPQSAEVVTPPLDAPAPSSTELPITVQPKKNVSHTMAGSAKAASVGRSPMPDSDDATPDPVGSRPTTASHPALAEAGFVCSLFGLGVPLLGVLGLILSIAARRQAQRLGMAKGLSTAGIVIGVIGTVVGPLLLLVALVG